jgi:hypothetical protein
MVHSITLSFNLNFHDCVSTNNPLLEVMYVEIEDCSSGRNKRKHTPPTTQVDKLFSPQTKHQQHVKHLIKGKKVKSNVRHCPACPA